jgi:hypothetical protein
MNASQLRVVAYLRATHKAGCAEHDPTPGWCDCGATQEPLVKLSDVSALIEVSRPSPPAQRKPLTDDEIWREYQARWPFHPAEEPRLAADLVTFARAIEAAHEIKEKS